MKEHKHQKTIHNLERFISVFFIFGFSGIVYGMIELLFRGRTAISMVIVGGFCGLIISFLNDIFTYEMDYILQGIMCSIFITTLEFIAGITLNNDFLIWDYRNLSGTFGYGHCNIYFVFAWFVLSMVFIPILDYIEWKIFNYKKDTPPYYKVFGKILFSLYKLY